MKERVGKGKMAVIVNTTWLHGLCIYFYFCLELITSSTFGIQQSVTTRSFKWWNFFKAYDILCYVAYFVHYI